MVVHLVPSGSCILVYRSLVLRPIPSFSMLHASHFSACNIEKLGIMGLGTRLVYRARPLFRPTTFTYTIFSRVWLE